MHFNNLLLFVSIEWCNKLNGCTLFVKLLLLTTCATLINLICFLVYVMLGYSFPALTSAVLE